MNAILLGEYATYLPRVLRALTPRKTACGSPSRKRVYSALGASPPMHPQSLRSLTRIPRPTLALFAQTYRFSVAEGPAL